MVARFPVSFGESDLRTLVAGASNGHLYSSDNHMCDGPSTTIKGYLEDSTSVILYETGGCGTPRSIRHGGEAFVLMNIVQTFCPEIHGF